ncbi:MAG: hypothetical protein ABWY20_23095 [Mycobacterium sp.]
MTRAVAREAGTPLVTPRTGPPMTEAEYQAALASLDAERAALVYEYTTSQTYPRWAYHATEPAQLVDSDAEALALGEGWSATPVEEEAAAPVVTALVPDTAAIGSPSFTLHVHGTGFAPDAVIVWNGSDEPTTVVSATEVTTEVNMATATAAVAVPVAVRHGDVVSNALAFTFTEATP